MRQCKLLFLCLLLAGCNPQPESPPYWRMTCHVGPTETLNKIVDDNPGPDSQGVWYTMNGGFYYKPAWNEACMAERVRQ